MRERKGPWIRAVVLETLLPCRNLRLLYLYLMMTW